MSQNWKSVRTKHVVKLLMSARRRILLTGTPALARPEEVFVNTRKYFRGLFSNKSHMFEKETFESFADYAKKILFVLIWIIIISLNSWQNLPYHYLPPCLHFLHFYFTTIFRLQLLELIFFVRARLAMLRRDVANWREIYSDIGHHATMFLRFKSRVFRHTVPVFWFDEGACFLKLYHVQSKYKL